MSSEKSTKLNAVQPMSIEEYLKKRLERKKQGKFVFNYVDFVYSDHIIRRTFKNDTYEDKIIWNKK